MTASALSNQALGNYFITNKRQALTLSERRPQDVHGNERKHSRAKGRISRAPVEALFLFPNLSFINCLALK